MWSSVVPVDTPAPSARSKHSATLFGEHVYLLGGRNGNLPMKDFWKYSLVTGKWQQLRPTGDRLPALQEHTAVAYHECIYVFGGEVAFSDATETPLWCYNVKNNNWKKIRTKKGANTPKGRRGHTALIHRGSMLVYGGYQDLRGSCGELWAFHFDTESWHLVFTSKTASEFYPAPRHKHSAVIYDEAMWIFGGMTDLQERGDLWKWDIASKNWTNFKTKINPGPLHSHAACKLPSSMLIFAGEKNGQPTNELWKFHFAMGSWERLNVSGTKPQPRSESILLVVSELLLKGSYPGSVEARIRSQTCSSADRNRHSSYFPNNKIAPCEKTYVFTANQSNYTDGSEVSQNCDNKKSFLQEISKLSQMNIPKLNGRCTYTGATDSTESLLKQQASHNENGNVTPPLGAMVKSKSAYVIKKESEKKRVEFDKLSRDPISVPNFSSLTPVETANLVQLENENLQVLTEFRREESYSSHLAYADNPLYQHMVVSSKTHNCVSFAGHNNEISSTSDYASIETVNRLSSASNYSVKTNNLTEENGRNQEKGPFGFCNPNYVGPEINNPKLHNSQEDLLELQEMNGTFSKDSKVYFSRRRPPFALDNNVKRPHQSKNRALSASRVENRCQEKEGSDSFVPLYVYVIGGKERGQVTVFKRPVSIWKLQLF